MSVFLWMLVLDQAGNPSIIYGKPSITIRMLEERVEKSRR